MISRRGLLGAGAIMAGAAAWTKTSAMSLPDAPEMASPDMQPPLFPESGPDYQPVVTLNGWTLPHRVRNGVLLDKEEADRTLLHLAQLWGYRVRLVEVDNESGKTLKEHEALPMP